ncbi:MAG: GTP-binding protein, partial [Aliidongia sp.]
MRLRTLIAPTMGQAMDMLRRELGDDAIIVSTEHTDHGIKIVAALEESESEVPNIGTVVADPLGSGPAEDPIDLVH